MLRVRELVNRLKELPDQDAVVLIGEGTEPDVWLLVTGVVASDWSFQTRSGLCAARSSRRLRDRLTGLNTAMKFCVGCDSGRRVCENHPDRPCKPSR
jgi:hypothetical protein